MAYYQEELERLLSKFKDHEIEASFGVFINNKFTPGVSRYAYLELSKWLNTRGYTYTQEISTVQISANGIRKTIMDGKIEYDRKTRDSGDIINYIGNGYRIRAAREENNVTSEDRVMFSPVITRIRKRKSYSNSDVSIDLTTVDETGNRKAIRKYEVEIELKRYLDPFDFYRYIDSVDITLRGLYSVPAEINRLDVKNAMINLMKGSNFHSKPINIKIDALLHIDSPYITLKLDGERRFLFGTKAGVFMLNTSFEIWADVWMVSENTVGKMFIVDGEFYQGKFYAFDLLLLDQDVRDKVFAERLELLNSLIRLYNNPSVILKEYYFTGARTDNVYADINSALNVYNHDIHDGIILQSSGKYISKGLGKETYKWKPSNKMTIDFLAKRSGVGKNKYDLYIGNNVKFVYEDIVGVLESTEDINNEIVECTYNVDTKQFQLLRTRIDKFLPNTQNTAIDVFRDIIRPINEDTMRGKTLDVMRRYHNVLKTVMLTLMKNKSILDVGSGQGGDLGKWEKIGINKVFIVEPDVSGQLEELFKRACSMNLTVDVMVYPTNPGIENAYEVLKLIGNEKIDATTAFFSLTFMMSSEEFYLNFLHTLKSVNSKKVMGIVLDGEKLYEYIENGRKKLGNDYKKKMQIKKSSFEISQVSRFPDTLEQLIDNPFGHKINIKFTDRVAQTEWLFIFSRFEKDMIEMGYKLKIPEQVQSTIAAGNENITLPKDSILLNSFNRVFTFER
jgi:hypothetical protein